MSQIIHATMMKINHIGTLITGSAGIGKSDLALALLDRGHQLISDDAVVLSMLKNRLLAKSPASTQNYLVARNIGLIPVNHYFGNEAILEHYPVDCEIHLCLAPTQRASENALASQDKTVCYLGIEIPQHTLHVCESRPLALLLELLLRKHYDPEKNHHRQ